MTLPSAVETLNHPLFEQNELHVQIKRDDLIHPVISGNKWRKLKGNLEYAASNCYQGIISFGGAYSNHIHALAYAGKLNNIETIGIIRGQAHYANNATLTEAQQWGMKLHFVDHQTYKRRYQQDYLAELSTQYPNYFIVPEGGSNSLALSGVAEICTELSQQTDFDTLITPVGSAGTFTGLISGDKNRHHILGVAVLKQAEYLNDEIKKLLASSQSNSSQFKNWQLLTDFHGGGYAKFSNDNVRDILAFQQQTNLQLEPIYSGKMILALLTLIQQGYFPKGHKIMLLHTGGLQGLKGLAEQKRINLTEWL